MRLAARLSPMRRAHAWWLAVQGASDAEREVSDARWDQHWPTDTGGPPAHRKGSHVHGAYGAEMRELRRLMRVLDEEHRRVMGLVK